MEAFAQREVFWSRGCAAPRTRGGWEGRPSKRTEQPDLISLLDWLESAQVILASSESARVLALYEYSTRAH